MLSFEKFNEELRCILENAYGKRSTGKKVTLEWEERPTIMPLEEFFIENCKNFGIEKIEYEYYNGKLTAKNIIWAVNSPVWLASLYMRKAILQ